MGMVMGMGASSRSVESRWAAGGEAARAGVVATRHHQWAGWSRWQGTESAGSDARAGAP